MVPTKNKHTEQQQQNTYNTKTQERFGKKVFLIWDLKTWDFL